MQSIRLHLRILVPPEETVKTLIDSCQSVFSPAGVKVDVRSEKLLNLSLADQIKFAPVKVFNSCQGTAASTEQKDLFALATNIDARDVVVFLVHSTDKALDGCAQHPAGRPGATVAALCGKWTLAHELGHLLCLAHVNEKSRLMFNGGTIGITANPPVLIQSEIDTIHESNLLH